MCLGKNILIDFSIQAYIHLIVFVVCLTVDGSMVNIQLSTYMEKNSIYQYNFILSL